MNRLFLSSLIAFFSLTANAKLVINEVMQSNIDCIMDDFNEFPDSWVEIYNPSNSAVNLQYFYISLTDSKEGAYKLPNRTIAANGYELIYCDKEGKDMHADFRLESGKDGSVYLLNSLGSVVDSYVKMKKQPAPNISYGRETDGSKTLGYMLKPTPKAANTGGIVDNKKILGEPVFSMGGQVFTENKTISLSVTLPDDAPSGTVIRYTTDGSEPTAASPLFPSSPLTVKSSLVIRAKLFCDGWLSPRSTVNSYLFHARRQTLPVISIVTDNKYFYDSKLGIYVEGSFSTKQKNYEYDWRRPVNIEYFAESGHAADMNQLCETRIQGGATRNNKFKSLAVYANKRFGEKRFNYEFFPEVKPGLNEFKSILLRNSGNDFDYLYFRDAAIQQNAATNCDLDWQAWQPAVVYLNGKYLCMLNIRERSHEDNIYSNYDGLEDIDLIENYYDLKQGTMDSFNELKAFYSADANPENTNMDNYTRLMDIDEFINLMAINTFHNNLDFPGNNIVYWRPRTANGKWRWIMKDTDFGLGLYGRSYQYKYLHWLYDPDFDMNNRWGNESRCTRLFRRLMADARFKDRFIDRLVVFMGSFLNGDGLGQTIDYMYDKIKVEYPYHRKLINQWWPNHQEEVNNAKNWAKNRTTFMKDYLKSYFNIQGTLKSIMVNKTFDGDISNYRFSLNHTWLKTGQYSGELFSGREVTVSAEPVNEDVEPIGGWMVTVSRLGKNEETVYRGTTASFIMPADATTVIVEALRETTGIESVENVQPQDSNSQQIFSIDGKRVSSPSKSGIYIIKEGNRVRKVLN